MMVVFTHTKLYFLLVLSFMVIAPSNGQTATAGAGSPAYSGDPSVATVGVSSKCTNTTHPGTTKLKDNSVDDLPVYYGPYLPDRGPSPDPSWRTRSYSDQSRASRGSGANLSVYPYTDTPPGAAVGIDACPASALLPLTSPAAIADVEHTIPPAVVVFSAPATIGKVAPSTPYADAGSSRALSSDKATLSPIGAFMDVDPSCMRGPDFSEKPALSFAAAFSERGSSHERGYQDPSKVVTNGSFDSSPLTHGGEFLG